MRDRQRGLVQGSESTASSSDGGFSRREFLRFNAALLALASVSSCSWPDDETDLRRALRILRPEDLLSLRFDLTNLRIVHERNTPSRLERIRQGDDAWVTVVFPGQHIAEQTFPEPTVGGEPGGDGRSILLPAQTRMARPSRLTFRIPRDTADIELNLDALLDWGRWAYEPAGAEDAGRSVIEMPTGLALAPDEAARWVHASRPVTYDGRTELWHTRLVGCDGSRPVAIGIEQPSYDTGDLDALDPALTGKDRALLTGRRANARTLILSPMGGWLDVYGRWEKDPSISRWAHRITAGQDQRVLIERAQGFLFPFGHAATLITVTERKLGVATSAAGRDVRDAALLRKRDFIVIKEPTVAYAHGEMAIQALTAQVLVTPPLYGADATGGPFWAETAPGRPYLFRFSGEDWAGHEHKVEAPAVFMAASHDIQQAIDVHVREPDRRIADLRGQSVVVARFTSERFGDRDGWGEPLRKPRSEGDTTLRLLSLSFSGEDASATAQPERAPFRCRTSGMRASLPSLEPYLPDERNRGWFDLDDPDAQGNQGELFARAREARIPMAFDQQADRCGGVATPSFAVDGMSRTLGPVGDAERIRSGAPLDYGSYFADGAELLGGFPLGGVLRAPPATRSPAIPRIDFILSRKQPDKTDERGAQPHWQVGLGLTWQVPLGKLGIGPIEFRPVLDEESGDSLARLEIAARATKVLGRQANGADESDDPAERDTPTGDATENGERHTGESAVDWSVSGKITKFAIALTAGKLGSLEVGFHFLGVTLGPAKPEDDDSDKANGPEPQPDPGPGPSPEPDPDPDPRDEPDPVEEPEPSEEPERRADTDPQPDPDADADADRGKEDEADGGNKLDRSLDYELSGIAGTGALSFINPLMAAAAKMPELPDLSFGEESSSYPAGLPDASDADLSVTVGPIESPTFKWLQFEVSNVSATIGVGLYFFPRPGDGDEPPAVPPNLFTIRVASADNPVTLIAEPWGGVAHIAFNFTSEGLTGFQFGLGVTYRATIDLGAGKARCEGSLVGVFTYELVSGGTREETNLIMGLSGKAVIAGFIDVYLSLIAVGSRQNNDWEFYAEITVRVTIGFFSVKASFVFRYRIEGEKEEPDRLKTAAPSAALAAPELQSLTKEEWLQYRSAFSGAL